MKLSIKAGTTSKLLDLFIQDSSSTVGAGLTGVAWNTATITAYYYREGAASAVSCTPSQTMTLGTWVTAGFIVVDGTNMPGCYQFGIPDAALAAGAKSVLVLLKGVTNMAPVVLEIELTGWDNQDAVHGGMSALPNTACTTNASLLTSGTGTAQLSVGSGLVTLAAVTHTGARIPNVTLADTITTYTSNTPQTGDAYARVGAAGAGLTAIGDTRIGNLDAAISTRTKPADTQAAVTLVATTTALTNAPTAGDFTATMKTSITTAATAATPTVAADPNVALIKAKTDNLPASPAAVTDVRTQVDAALDAAGSELAAIPGAAGTLRQKLGAIYQYLMFKRTTTAAVETLYKNDGATSLGTSTVSDDLTTATHGKVA